MAKLKIDLDSLSLSTDKESANIYITEHHFDINYHIREELEIRTSHNYVDSKKCAVLKIGSNNIYINDLDTAKKIKEEMESVVNFLQKEV